MAVPVNRLLSLSSVHLLVLEKLPEPPPHHGALLHRHQMSGGAGQNVQPGVQESLLIQTSSSATEEGERSGGSCRSLKEEHVLSFSPLFTFLAVVTRLACGLWHT